MTLHLYSWEKTLVEQALPSQWSTNRQPSPQIGTDLDAAYAACDRVTEENSRSFSLASRFLPEEKRRAVRALYAFCRFTDDIVDLETEGRTQLLQEWRSRVSTNHFLENDDIVNGWLDTRIRYHIPTKYIEQFLDGVARDLDPVSYDSFDELAQYCYGVASTVGLMSMAIVGYTGHDAVPYAVRLGIALQMTNILRDVAEDWQRGRIYLPQDELDAFNISRSDLVHSIETGAYGEDWRAFMRFQIERTRRLYAEAWPGIAELHPDGRFAIAAAADLYAGILDDIEAHDYDVFSRRAHVSDWKKLRMLPLIMNRVRRLPAFPSN